MYLANFVLYGQKSLSLENLALFFNIDFSGSHRAINDVKITLEVFKKLIEELKKFSDKKFQILEYIFSKTNDK
jgi:DNA polymerase III epsilon subunit-like protein